MRHIFLLAFFALAACGHAIVTESSIRGETEYRLEWKFSAVDSLSNMEQGMALEATRLCPGGWRKARAQRVDRGILVPTVIWYVRCAPHN